MFKKKIVSFWLYTQRFRSEIVLDSQFWRGTIGMTALMSQASRRLRNGGRVLPIIWANKIFIVNKRPCTRRVQRPPEVNRHSGVFQ